MAAPDTAPPVTGTTVARNASAAFTGQLAILVMSFVATGVIVRELGARAYGTWSLVAAVVAYAGLLDLGLGVSLVRRIAESERGDDRASSGEAMGAALVVTAFMGVVAAALIWLLAGQAATVLKVPAELRGDFVSAMRIAAIGAGVALPGSALGAAAAALQKLPWIIRLEVAVTLLTLSAQLLLTVSGGGITALAAAFAAGRGLSLAGRWVIARRLLRGTAFRSSPRYPFWTSLGRFGLLKAVHQLLSQIVLYLDRLLVGAMVSVEAVAYYTVALELSQRLLMVQSNVAQAYYPAACALASDRPALRKLYRRAAGSVALFTLPAALLLALFARPILALWVGADFADHAAPVLAIAALAYGGMSLTAIPSVTADALDQPGLSVRYGLASVAINVVLALILIPRLGAAGAAWAILGNVVLQGPFFVLAVNRLMNRRAA